MTVVCHCKMHKNCMNKHNHSSRDECNEGVSDECKDFASLLIANFTQHEDPPLVTCILKCASAHKLPCKDDEGSQWNKALECVVHATARKVMMDRHWLHHKEPFVKLAASFIAECTLLHHPKNLLHCCKLNRVSKKAFKVHGSVGSRLPWSRNKFVPFRRTTNGLDIHFATAKKFETMGAPQIDNMIGCVATGLPSHHAKCNML